MHVAVVANRADPETGYVGERLELLGARVERVWREEPLGPAVGIERFDLVLHLGSDWSVYDPRFASAVAVEQDLVRHAARRGTPTLAICFGAQLVASALGLVVERAPTPEIGWYRIETDDGGICPSGPWFQFHGDRWQDASDRYSIARSKNGPQALSVGRILALQFHPEAESRTIGRWIRERPLALAEAGTDAAMVAATTIEVAQQARTRCFSLVDAFLERCASSGTDDQELTI